MFYRCTSLASVTIGNGVTEIGDSAFYDCEALQTVYYVGTEENWKSISISSDDNDALTSATICFYSETEAVGCWYYDEDGNITEW